MNFIKNKNGFAISVILYAMVILVIGIFYLLLGIVKNRYTVGNNLKEAVISSMGDVDTSSSCQSGALIDLINANINLFNIDSDGKLEKNALYNMVKKFESNENIHCMTGAILTDPDLIRETKPFLILLAIVKRLFGSNHNSSTE